MKKIKRFTLIVSASIFALSLFACQPTAEVSSQPSSSESSSSAPVEEMEEINYYDDEGKYDAIIDDTEYAWSDSEGLQNGEFSDGTTSKPYASFTQASVENGEVTARYSNAETAPSVSYVSGTELANDVTLDSIIKRGECGSHDDAMSYDIASNNYAVIKNTDKKKSCKISIKPQCTQEEFLEADYIKFYVCLYNPPVDSSQSRNTVTMYFKNTNVLRLFRCTWYEIKIPLEIWRSCSGGFSYHNKEALYSSLMGETVQGDNANLKGVFLQLTALYADGDARNEYTLYVSSPTLGVENVDETLGRDLSNLTETALYNGKELPCNSYMYWGNTSVVRRKNEENIPVSMLEFSSNYNGGNVVVIPQKRYSQVEKYDYVYITMYIETENPNAIEIGVNGYYNVNYKTLSSYESWVDNYKTLVSPNKWITVKFPVRALAPLYARMQTNRWFTVADDSRNFQQEGVGLFYVNGNTETFEKDETGKKYPFKLYLSRVFLVKEDT